MNDHEHVLQRMAEDIELRGLSPHTLESYTSRARAFLTFSHNPVAQLDAEDIRRFLSYLIHEKKASPTTVNVYSAAIRFLFAVTLNRTLNYLQVPRQKKHKTLPQVLTRQEISAILENCYNLKQKAMLMLVYSAGLRVSEVAAIKTSHIDSQAMRVFVEGGKGNKDRYTLLSNTCLHALRDYWRAYRPHHPQGWLFVGTHPTSHITVSTIQTAFYDALKKASVTKRVSVHTLRHSFATHLLEDGATLLQIKELLGHASIQSTTVYLHVANTTRGLTSPLDRWCSQGAEPVLSHA